MFGQLNLKFFKKGIFGMGYTRKQKHIISCFKVLNQFLNNLKSYYYFFTFRF